MSGIKHLREVHKKKGDDFLRGLLNDFVIINEIIEGSFIGLRKDQSTDRFKYFKKSGEITYVDRMLTRFYNPAVSHFENMPESKRKRIPSNFYFGFQYFSPRSGSQKKPKNGLVLTYIHRLDEEGKPIETLQTKEDLSKWAFYLEVGSPFILFEGMLDDDQKTSLLDFVHTPKKELIDRFKTISFTKHIISTLCDDETRAELEGSGIDLNGIVFRFYDENDENPRSSAFLAKMIDPIFDENSEEVKVERKSNDYIWLILIDLMNHIEIYSEDQLRAMCEGAEDYDHRYSQMMDRIFKDFIERNKNKYEGLDLDVPEYLRSEDFDIDWSLLKDPEIESKIKGNETYKEIYRILMNFFRKTRRKSSSGFFGPDLINQLNIQIKKIKRIVMGDVIYEGLFPSFGEFIGTDNYGEDYLEKEERSRKKKKPKKVNLIVGGFQPPHIGHLKAAEKLKSENGLDCVLICTHAENRSPLSEHTTRILLEKVQQNHSDSICDVRIVKSKEIKKILSSILPQYEAVLWGSSKNRIRDYVLQLDHIKKRNIPLRMSKDLKLVQLPSYQNGEDILQMIKDSNFREFKEKVPKCISSEFFNLQTEINSKEEA
jgi:nicotinamide mononucleotide adenylyltransferase